MAKIVLVDFNGNRLQLGEVFADYIVDDAFIQTNSVTADRIEHRKRYGVTYKVVKMRIPDDEFSIKEAQSQYYFQLNDLLEQTFGKSRFSRCLIPQADGSYKVCARYKDGDRVSCTTCPDKGKYPRQQKNTIPIHELNDSTKIQLVAPNNTETEALWKIMLEDSLQEKKNTKPAIKTATEMYLEGMPLDKIVEEIMKEYGLKSSQSYLTADRAFQLIKRAIKGL